jgi:hypothetical protein
MKRRELAVMDSVNGVGPFFDEPYSFANYFDDVFAPIPHGQAKTITARMREMLTEMFTSFLENGEWSSWPRECDDHEVSHLLWVTKSGPSVDWFGDEFPVFLKLNPSTFAAALIAQIPFYDKTANENMITEWRDALDRVEAALREEQSK